MNKLKLAVVSAVIGLIGFGIFVYAAGWLAGIGLFIAMYGNNLMLATNNIDD